MGAQQRAYARARKYAMADPEADPGGLYVEFYAWMNLSCQNLDDIIAFWNEDVRIVQSQGRSPAWTRDTNLEVLRQIVPRTREFCIRNGRPSYDTDLTGDGRKIPCRVFLIRAEPGAGALFEIRICQLRGRR